ncbi:GreA/GreB family elongation factor [Paenibacillus agricola]|uniref:GreA/GreB family elongation factor n=1 Tax=Paenibacillus agricola TaxID=2716264 RepID=A0ABX0JDP3_9BACL|nr:GreA/GreB family elongation factor [Paenibacillus agricola]NHN33379.1 GreA/GreB family elongation factor [Paenibacillus agricola]
MNHRLENVSVSKTQLINQLVYFDEEKSNFLNLYFPAYGRERTDMDQLLVSYCEELELILTHPDEKSIHSTVLIGSQVKLRYLDDDFIESFSIVFPEQTKPDNNHISFLSPIGKQILLSKPTQAHQLYVPSGVIHLSIEEIQYMNWGDLSKTH